MTALDLCVIECREKIAKRLIPLWSLFCAVVALFFGGQLVFSGMTEGYCLIWPGIGTTFTDDFSHRGFDRIKPGMTPAEVRALIGEPMGVGYGCSPSGWSLHKPFDLTWSYSHDSSKLGGDWAWLAREVVFRDGRVVQVVRWTYHD